MQQQCALSYDAPCRDASIPKVNDLSSHVESYESYVHPSLFSLVGVASDSPCDMDRTVYHYSRGSDAPVVYVPASFPDLPLICVLT